MASSELVNDDDSLETLLGVYLFSKTNCLIILDNMFIFLLCTDY